MGQTLTNGIYLPDEGERNAYSGLEANWRTLDALILTVNGKAAPNIANTWTAAQTFTAGIAGDLTGNVTGDLTGTASKAIADEDGTSIKTGYVNVAGNQTVTGNKEFTGSNTFNNILPNATNTYALGSSSYQWSSVYAQSYYYNGTQWGLDQANVWTDTQTYSAGSYGQKILLKNTGLDLSVNGNTGLSSTYQHVISWVDKNNTIYSSIQSWASDANNTLVLRSYYRTDANTSRNLSVRFVNTATDKSIYSETNADTDLGTSTNQWKSVYAQTYYYNGTAWGLGKENVWSAENTYTNAVLTLKQTELETGVTPATNQTRRYRFTDKNNVNLGWVQHRVNTSGDSYIELYAVNKFDNSQLSPQGTAVANSFAIGLKGDGTRYASIKSDLYPAATNTYDLGTSTNKWKTLNGINPGALSLPSRGYNDSIALDTTNWDYAGNGFIISIADNNDNYIPGWVVIVAEDVGDVSDFIKIRLTSYTRSPGLDFTTFYTGSQYNIKACFPTAGIGYLVLKLTNGASCIKYARYYPCLGNV